jgi:hypothetical protein
MNEVQGEARGALKLPDLTALRLPGEALVRRTWSLLFLGLGLLLAVTLATLTLVPIEVTVEGSGSLLEAGESPRRAELFVPAAQGAALRAGQPVRLTLPGRGTVLDGELQSVEQDRPGPLVRVWVTVSGGGAEALPPGVGVEGRIRAGREVAWHRLLRAAGRGAGGG